MKINGNLKLRKIGKKYMIVDISSSDVDFTSVYSLNETAAFLWEKIESREFVETELVDLICSNYDVDREKAMTDVRRIISLWKTHGLVKE